MLVFWIHHSDFPLHLFLSLGGKLPAIPPLWNIWNCQWSLEDCYCQLAVDFIYIVLRLQVIFCNKDSNHTFLLPLLGFSEVKTAGKKLSRRLIVVHITCCNHYLFFMR